MPDRNKIIALAADHAGFELKGRIAEFLQSEDYAVLDLGTHSGERVDYPDFGALLGRAIAEGKAGRGVAICGSGAGICIAANRNRAVRAVVCNDVLMAKLARLHNDANVIAFGSRLIGELVALEALNVFLNTGFEGGRHAERVKKLGQC